MDIPLLDIVNCIITPLFYLFCKFKCSIILFLLQDGINVLAVNYGSPGACQYPRQFKLVSPDQTFYHSPLF